MPLSATDQQYTSMEPRRTHAGAWRTELVEEIDSFLEQQRREQQRRDEERRDEERRLSPAEQRVLVELLALLD
jgi:hypothetical protein